MSLPSRQKPVRRVRAVGRSRAAQVALALVVALGVTACAASPTTEENRAPTAVPSAPPAPPTEPPAAALPEVPVRSTDLGPVVHPPAPVSLSITALAVDLPVDPVGIQADGQMEIPPLAERAGWYRFGAAPDQAGTAVIAAHVDSVASAGLGPFAKLQELAAGDLVDVALDDGTTRQYAVSSVTKVPKSAVTWPDVFTRDGPHRLALITCGGAFDDTARSYVDNVIVIADPVGG